MHEELNVLVELERLKVETTFSSDENVKILCPFHKDTTPNCNVHLKTGQFKCFSAPCGAKGNFVKLFAKISDKTERQAFAELSERYEWSDTRIVDLGVVQKWHNKYK